MANGRNVATVEVWVGMPVSKSTADRLAEVGQRDLDSAKSLNLPRGRAGEVIR